VIVQPEAVELFALCTRQCSVRVKAGQHRLHRLTLEELHEAFRLMEFEILRVGKQH